jgi:hypothetical protein
VNEAAYRLAKSTLIVMEEMIHIEEKALQCAFNIVMASPRGSSIS